MTESDRAQLLRQAFDAFDRGDIGWLCEHLADDVTWHLGGHHKFSGDYQGRDAIRDLFERSREATGDTIRFDPKDVLANESHAVALGTGTATNSKGERAEFNFAIVVRADSDRATEVWDLSEVGPSTDEFFDSLPG